MAANFLSVGSVESLSDKYVDYGEHYRNSGNAPLKYEVLLANPILYGNERPWFPPNKNAVILDIGCGFGHQLAALYVAGYRTLYGIDLSPASVELAQKGLRDLATISFGEGTTFLKDKTETFDCIIANDVIEHLPIDLLTLFFERVTKALKVGGIFVCRTPNMASLFGNYSRYIDNTHINGFTSLSLKQYLAKTSLERISFVSDTYECGRGWSLKAPWRRLGLRAILNHYLHRILFAIRDQQEPHQLFAQNLECYAYKAPLLVTTQ